VSYDPLIAKLTASAESRDSAIARALAALRAFPILGIRTNIPFLIKVLDHPAFRAGRVDTGFVDEHLKDLLAAPDAPPEACAAAALASVTPPSGGTDRQSARSVDDPWTSLEGWGR
jgi:acetyl/propionyl-CoA carboxylase alpha subunit